MNVKRLNHAVLWVRDARASAAFYGDALGFQVVEADPSGRAVFLRAGGSDNHHDLGLFSVGERPSPAPRHARAVPPGLAGGHDRGPRRRRRRRCSERGVARRRDRPRRLQEPLRQGSRRHRVRGDVAGARRTSGAPTPSTPAASRSTSPPSSARWAGVATGWPALAARGQRSSTARRALQRRVGGTEAVGLEHPGQDPLALEEQGVGPLAAEQQPRGRTPGPAGSSGGAARRRACRRTRRWSPASAR